MWTKQKSIDNLIHIILFLSATGLFLHGMQLFLLAAILVFVFKDREKKELSENTSLIILTLFAGSYYVFAAFHDINGLSAFILPAGYYIGCSTQEATEKKIIRLIIILAFGFGVRLALNFIHNYNMFGALILQERTPAYDIWLKDTVAATSLLTNGIMVVSLFFYFVQQEDSYSIRITGVLLGLISLVYTLVLGERTIFLMFVLSIFTGLILGREQAILSHSKNVYKQLFIFLVLIILLSLLFIQYNDSLTSLYFDSNFYRRFFSGASYSENITRSSRVYYNSFYLSQMPEYLWGGRNLFYLSKEYAHNLWLDVYDSSGIIPFLLLLLYTIFSLSRIICVIFLKDEPAFRLVVGTVCLCLFVEFFLEPALIGCPLLVASYCVIDAAVAKKQIQKGLKIHEM